MSLKVGFIQANLFWEDIDKNLAAFEKKLLFFLNPDLIVLPEMFNTGFSMHAEYLAEPMNGKTIHWMLTMAKKHNTAIVGSLIIKENKQYFNRLIWAAPNGSLLYYDKRHLFSLAQEEQTYSSGKEQLIINYKGWRISPFICYDLRFPVWSRNTQQYDLAIYVANWPAKRAYHWKQLLLARSIENQCFTLACNRVGQDNKGYDYSGNSMIIHPSGIPLVHCINKEQCIQMTLELDDVKTYRKQFPFLSDQDSFKLLK